ncbi:dyp-type peroxidase [Pleurotus djamor]|nr:dyp-type peroxidase [Pleurotus djamor]
MRWSTVCVALASLTPSILVGASSHLYTRRSVTENHPVLRDLPGHGAIPPLEEIQKLNATNGNYLPLDEIQADVMVGMRKAKELMFFYTINNPKRFKRVLAKALHPLITSTAQLICLNCTLPNAMLNVAWTARGLNKLGVKDNLLDEYFHIGQAADADDLGDDPGLVNWAPGFKSNQTDGVFLIASQDWDSIDSLFSRIQRLLGPAITETHRTNASVRPGEWAGHEHFGFLDGFIQPAVAGFATSTLPGQSLIFPGTVLTGEIGDPLADERPAWMKWGSFLAYRQLQELVPEWDRFLWNQDNATIGNDPNLNNNFDFNHPAPFDINSNQTLCPFSAHIRKVRPRGDQNNTNIANQIVRTSVPYGPELTDEELATNTTKFERGVAFVAYQSDIGLGLRFQTISMANNVNFPYGKSDSTPGSDPIYGQANGASRSTSGLDPLDPNREFEFHSPTPEDPTNVLEFVVPRGGDYFFSPSISAILNVVAA